ncbi:DEAD/DEAH box helicase [Candidatus Woesearchaeota archaeon]|nr:DEAD/DEAH box helicase [Candidatus Woesearchaeota archaeon]
MNTKGITLKPEFEKAILDLGFSEFTEIQEKCIPIIREGKDLIGLSHTGSGKTAAFGFPSLEKVIPERGIQLLVIVPTRELCNQVAKEFVKFTKYRRTDIVEVYGGISIGPQIQHLRRADVVIGTPGRLLDHLSRGTLNTNNIKILILDEADKMFEMGFINDIRKIISRIPKNSQKLLFGATMPQEIMNIANKYMNNPKKVKMQEYVDKSKLVQHYYQVDKHKKFSLLAHIIKKELRGLVIVFCSTRHIVDIVDKSLAKQNIKTQALHGGMTQGRRNQVMELFRNGKLDVLVASDVAARGLDIKNVNLIINYNLPKTSQDYVHRIGRTARAGNEGKVISLLSPDDHDNFRRILEDRSLLIHKIETPHFENIEFSKPQYNKRPSYNRFSRNRRY